MSASIETLQEILKEFYLGPVQEQINQEVMVYELFDKASVEWSGRNVIIPLHIGRNASTGFRAEGGTLPGTPAVVGDLPVGNQTYEQLFVTAKFLYGRFSLTGPAISAARAGSNSFISYVEAEMNKLVDDVKNASNRTMVSGGRCVGFTHQKANIAAGNPVEFSGDTQKLNDVAVIAAALGGINGISVKFVRTDTYADITGGVCEVSAANVAAGTFTIAAASAVGYGAAAVPTGVAIAVVIDDTRAAVLTALQNAGFFLDAEPLGIYGNLFATPLSGVQDGGDDYFRIDRSAAANVSLRSTGRCISGGGGTDPRAPVSLDALQSTMDAVLVEAGVEPNYLFIHPSMRSEYTALLVATSGQLFTMTDSAKNGDGGFTSLGFNGIPLKTSRHIDRGLVVMLKTDSWKITELESKGFADLDGNVLSRTLNRDAYEGYYRWYYNLVCMRPNANAVLTGLDFPA